MSDVKRYYVGINTKCLGGIGLVEMTDLYREATGFDGLVMGEDYDTLKAENERLERNRDMWKGQVELQAKELTSMHKDAEQWRALVGRAKDPVIGYTGCVICGSADHGGWSCQNHPGGKS